MNIELPTLSESIHSFNLKMNAAYFFLKKIRGIYAPGGKFSEVPDELFYYVDAVIFELHAASQMFLQIINVKSGVNENAHMVSWNPKFKKNLKENNTKLFSWWEEFNISPEFHILEAMRQYISHRGGSFLQVEVDENENITLLSIPIRFRYYKGKPELKPTGQSIELIDELNNIALYLNASYKNLMIY